MISEIACYGEFPANFEIVIQTKISDSDTEKSNITGDDLLSPLGFHLFEKGDAGKRYIEAAFIIANYETAMAFIHFTRPKENR